MRDYESVPAKEFFELEQTLRAVRHIIRTPSGEDIQVHAALLMRRHRELEASEAELSRVLKEVNAPSTVPNSNLKEGPSDKLTRWDNARQQNHVYVEGPVAGTCAVCGLRHEDQIHNGSLA